MVLTEKLKAKFGQYDYGVYHVGSLATGANNLSAGAFGMTKAWIISMGAADQATLSATGTAITTISTPENTGIGSNIVITGIETGDGAIIEVMGW